MKLRGRRNKLKLVLAIIFLPIILALIILFTTGNSGLVRANLLVVQATFELRMNPDNLSAVLRAGEGFYGLRNYTKSASYYVRATEIAPDNDLGWNGLGNAYRELSRYNDAEASYLRAISAGPKTAVYYLNLANLYRFWPSGNNVRDNEVKLILEDGAKATNNDQDIVQALVEYYSRVGDAKNLAKWQGLLER